MKSIATMASVCLNVAQALGMKKLQLENAFLQRENDQLAAEKRALQVQLRDQGQEAVALQAQVVELEAALRTAAGRKS